MVTDKERISEWLNRAADDVKNLRKKPRLSKQKKLQAIRESYNIISVLMKVAKREAYMVGIPPLINTTKQ